MVIIVVVVIYEYPFPIILDAYRCQQGQQRLSDYLDQTPPLQVKTKPPLVRPASPGLEHVAPSLCSTFDVAADASMGAATSRAIINFFIIFPLLSCGCYFV